jgi:hypothetical protein
MSAQDQAANAKIQSVLDVGRWVGHPLDLRPLGVAFGSLMAEEASHSVTRQVSFIKCTGGNVCMPFWLTEMTVSVPHLSLDILKYGCFFGLVVNFLS